MSKSRGGKGRVAEENGERRAFRKGLAILTYCIEVR